MLISPSPLPDEIARGYLGRIICLNGKKTRVQTIELARNWMGLPPTNECPLVDILIEISGLSQQEFVCKHTTLPLRRSITGHLPDLPHGSEDNNQILENTIRIGRFGAYFCTDCIEQQLTNYGISFWRRRHQIPGVLWCQEHHKSLNYVIEGDPFLSSPSKFLQSSDTIDEKLVSKLQPNRFIQIFLDISHALLDRKMPFNNQYVAYALRQRAIIEKIGFDQQNPLLSNVVRNSFDKDWLINLIPPKHEGTQTPTSASLDSIFFAAKAARSVTNYILGASVLYETASDALTDLINTSNKSANNVLPTCAQLHD